ncbi:MAG: hypothetical protein COU07_00775 [Candidatus Harrisonbacteria bacterium CG10_big_fil_rev_8_21_14_0_10_40_38]|uniref:Fibronectin type-III domain-containing protein n=1 Tax=Candidatus Harrisonbacteria bacterium CG10_big_fil_rev_8_21_14_0_10_40_38 TaxID=1974583 RepID=A0A2H0USN0_9BACT|nr:MAG: hypothetical protein COU07_00775 [Candidatus Harrisonbacteria bacterium CG10_big_fil_rev_8_21_14_0_10_40_38]
MKKTNNLFTKLAAISLAIGVLGSAIPVVAIGLPEVQTLPATGITSDSATLNGHVHQTRASDLLVWFEYGETESLGKSIGDKTVNWPDSEDANWSALIWNLKPNTTYYFRAVAQNDLGTSRGSLMWFTTGAGSPPSGDKPNVNTKSATNITTSAATLNGEAKPNGSYTDGWFEWGTTSNLGNTTNSQSLGNGSSFVPFSFRLNNLQSNKTYYFRAVARNSHSTSHGTTFEFNTNNDGGGSSRTPTVETLSADNITGHEARLNADVNPNGSRTYVWFEWGEVAKNNHSQERDIGSGTSFERVSETITGLKANTNYNFRAVARNSNGTTYGNTKYFTTNNDGNIDKPTVRTNPATDISSYSARLQGTVNPNGNQTNVWFEYGKTSSFGRSTGYQSVGSGRYDIDVSSYVSDLEINTVYYFRVVASNSYGTSYGQTRTFVTNQDGGESYRAPTVYTTNATGVTRDSAILNGSVNPNGATTRAWFEWGYTASLGNRTSYQNIGGGTSSFTVSAPIYNLSDNTTYYFRVVADNNYGTSYGSIYSFTTGTGSNSLAPYVTTLSPYSVLTNIAGVKANINPNGSYTDGWFEWGTTQSLGQRTTRVSVGSGNSYTELTSVLLNLSPNTTYYFRGVAQNSYGTGYGAIISFTTQGGGTTPPPSGGGTGSGIIGPTLTLTSSLDKSEVKVGEELIYKLMLKNTSSTHSLRNVKGTIKVPEIVSFLSANAMMMIENPEEISFNIDRLTPLGENEIQIKFRVNEKSKNNDDLTIQTEIKYSDALGRSYNVSTFATAKVHGGIGLLASISDLFTGASISLGWFLVILLLLIILGIAYSQWNRRKLESILYQNPPPPPPPIREA